MTKPSRLAVARRNLKLILGNPLGALGFGIVLLLVLVAIFADFIAPYGYADLNVRDRMQGPSPAHLLGTDQLGRDTFSRAVVGTRVALLVALPAVGGALFFGMLLGMTAALGARWLDNAIMLFLDTIRSFPTVMFALAVVALVGPSLATVVAVVMITSVPVYGRVARTQTLALVNSEFILAERTMQASFLRILFVHMLPNIFGVLAILAALDIPAVIALEAGLSFLGLGVKPPTPSWGVLLRDGYALIRSTPWLVVAGVIPVILATLGFTFFGEALRDVLDPKLRGRG
ncbi:MAG: ABC transporter permease [Alphaproteobacteria bacterium]|nr:ABC transporter permease [Alphaproteobacteria bacterium]MDA7983446.1 ABC transporter permease [Alphaproteobacteria bacterium]MDA7988969.1 ABC transporter permease [Alphaproteobacteria bacterium]MDA8010278.1 ABC transporter permease [Alphaproteobacteria bacterium]